MDTFYTFNINKEDIYNEEITLSQFNMDDIEETINITDAHENCEGSYSDTCKMLRKMEKTKKDTADEMAEEGWETKEEIKEFGDNHKKLIGPI